jgi:hypothetical protein
MAPPPSSQLTAGLARHLLDCPGRKPPIGAVKRPTRPQTSAVQNRLTMENAKAAYAPPRVGVEGPDGSRRAWGQTGWCRCSRRWTMRSTTCRRCPSTAGRGRRAGRGSSRPAAPRGEVKSLSHAPVSRSIENHSGIYSWRCTNDSLPPGARPGRSRSARPTR